MTTPISEEALIAHVIDWIREHRQPGLSDDIEISPDTDLVGSGVLDSLGIVDLVLFVERQHGCKVDLVDADPNEFSVVKGLCRIALSQNHVGSR
jgi:acyl carrier protein